MNFELEEPRVYPIGLFSKVLQYPDRTEAQTDVLRLASAVSALEKWINENEERVLFEQLSKFGYAAPGHNEYRDIGLNALKRINKVIGEIIEKREAENASRSNG